MSDQACMGGLNLCHCGCGCVDSCLGETYVVAVLVLSASETVTCGVQCLGHASVKFVTRY